MSDNRNTQFQGFAKALTDELVKYLTSRSGLTLDEIEQEWHKLLARRAYDFACHVASETSDLVRDDLTVYWGSNDAAHGIPDLTELPKESKE